MTANFDHPEKDQAIYWLAKLNDLNVTDADKHAFKEWYAQNPDKARLFDHLADLWQQPDVDQAILATIPNPIARKKQTIITILRDFISIPLPHFTTPFQFFKNGSARLMTAYCCLLLISTLFLISSLPQDIRYLAFADLQTKAGEQIQTRLPDGSEVTLNGQTSLAYDITDTHRHIDLYEGEAFFDIAPNTEIPLFVRFGSQTVRVVGTKFNIALNQAEQRFFLEEGQVIISHGSSSHVLDEKDLMIVSGKEIDIIKNAAAAPQLSWQKGELHFQNQSVADIFASLERQYDLTLVKAPTAKLDLHITGHYKTQNPQSILRNMAQIAKFDMVKLPGNLFFIF